jgi:putative ABC transport system permease protein
MLGGIIGLISAVTLTQIAFWFLPSFDLRAPIWIMAPAFVVSMIVGVVFGVWPARKAAYIETLDALRYE